MVGFIVTTVIIVAGIELVISIVKKKQKKRIQRYYGITKSSK